MTDEENKLKLVTRGLGKEKQLNSNPLIPWVCWQPRVRLISLAN